jgi:aminoglycoside phosphotransferase
VFPDPLADPITVPKSVETVINGRTYELIWLNGVGGLTFRVFDFETSVYIKWAPSDSGVDLASEARKMAWARKFISVPLVINQGVDNQGSWIVTEGIDAENAVAPRWTKDPQTAARALGSGLRALHEALPVTGCPFSWTVEQRMNQIKQKVAQGAFADHQWSDGFSEMNVDDALRELQAVPRLDLVVCHGDACAPNTLIGEDRQCHAHTDLGSLGVADRWADLAIASLSTVWNYGPGLEDVVYDSYGIEPDSDKIRFYRLLWEME